MDKKAPNRKYSTLNKKQKAVRRKSWLRIIKSFILQGPVSWRNRRAGRIWDYVVDFFQLIVFYDLFGQAASVVYYLLLTFFPILILTMYFVSMITRNIAFQPETVDLLGSFLPGPVLEIISSLTQNIKAPLSVFSLIISILTALWAASRGVGQVINGIINIYPKKDKSIPMAYRIAGIILTIVVFLLLALATMVMSFGRALFNFLNQHLSFLKIDQHVIDISTYGIGFLLIFAILYILYFIATKNSAANIPKFPGAIFATCGWILLSFFYSFYIANKANLASLYGGLANIIILMLWLNFTVQIIQYGALLNYQIAWYRMQNKQNYQILNQTIKEIGNDKNPFEYLKEENLKEENIKEKSSEEEPKDE